MSPYTTLISAFSVTTRLVVGGNDEGNGIDRWRISEDSDYECLIISTEIQGLIVTLSEEFR
jgi:hypothetical protein